MSEGHDVSFKNCHEYSLHSSFEGHFDCGKEELLLLEQHSQDKKMTEIFGGHHVFYDPVAEYMEIIFSEDDRSWVHNDGGMQQEGGGNSKMDASLHFLNPEIIFPNSVEEHDAILLETHMRNQFLN